MRAIPAFFRVLTVLGLGALAADAATILDIASALAPGDPTQTGRLSRNGVAQDWADSETFPGVINTGTTYHYQIYSVNVGVSSFVQIEFDDIAGLGRTFVAAYDGAYSPNSSGSGNFGFDTNWLGDAGSSGNFFGTDPEFFQVFVPANDDLFLVVNNTGAANGGVGDAFHLQVEGFINSDFDDAPAPSGVPEPSTVILSCGGFLLIAGTRMRRVR
jgi:hypothetical protein